MVLLRRTAVASGEVCGSSVMPTEAVFDGEDGIGTVLISRVASDWLTARVR